MGTLNPRKSRENRERGSRSIRHWGREKEVRGREGGREREWEGEGRGKGEGEGEGRKGGKGKGEGRGGDGTAGEGTVVTNTELFPATGFEISLKSAIFDIWVPLLKKMGATWTPKTIPREVS